MKGEGPTLLASYELFPELVRVVRAMSEEVWTGAPTRSRLDGDWGAAIVIPPAERSPLSARLF